MRSVSDPSHFDVDPDPGIHNGKSGSGSSDPPFHNSGSGSTFGKSGFRSGCKVDPDQSIYFHIFHIEIHVGQIKILIFRYRQNLEKAFLR